MLFRYAKSLIVLCCVLLCLQGAALFAQVGRATITGIVTDPTGAVIPEVRVIAIHAGTGVLYRSVTNTVGTYTISSLPIGPYQVRFTAGGFKELTQSGLTLSAGQIARVDAALQVGALTEKLDVTAEAPLLETETAQTSEGVDAKVFADLPLSFGGGRNMAEFASKLVPGVDGSAWIMKIQGTPQGSQEIIIDGMNNMSGFTAGDFQEQSISPEAIQEMTVFTGNVSAEMGRAAGGALNMTLKSGNNQVHGSGFYFLRNEVLNSNDWNNNRMLAADPTFSSPSTANFKRPKHRRFDKGFSVGGPVYLPKVYDGRDKTFFYFTLEKFNTSDIGPTSLNATVPLPEMWDGNLSRLLTGKQAGTDALGRPVAEGQIYDPATLHQVNGVFVADPFIGNIIPASRLSRVSRTFKEIHAKYYQPVTSDLVNNLYGNRAAKQDVEQGTLKVDHALSSNHKLSGFVYWNAFPRHGQNGGIWSMVEQESGGPLSTALLQQRSGLSWNVSHDWIVTPTILNHASYGINWNDNTWRTRHAGEDLHTQWGIKGVGEGLPLDKITPPTISLGGSPVVSYGSWGFGGYALDAFAGHMLNDTVTVQRRSHTLKFGFEYSRLYASPGGYDNTGGVFSFSSTTTGIPGQSFSSRVGNSFASFLLGEVNNASVNPTFVKAYFKTYAAAFAQDSWKVTPRLTLNLGLRWSGNSHIYEKQDRMATFNPLLPDPKANGMLGAIEYFGTGEGRSGRRTSGPGAWRDFGPTFGFAYRLTDKTVMRGGYGITFTPETIGWSVYGFQAGYAPSNSVPSNSKGLYIPVFNIDNGYPGVTKPPSTDPSWSQNNSSTLISPEASKAGYIQHFNFGFQHQLKTDLVIEADWRSSKSTRVHNGGIVRPNQIRPEYLSKGAVLGQVIDSQAKANAAGLPYPYPGWVGTGAQTLNPFPQITNRGLGSQGDPVGFTNYHSGNLIVTKRMSKGLYLYGAYTFQKSIGNVNDALKGGEATGYQDTYNRQVYKTVLPDDRTHVIKAAFTWELPFGKGKPLLKSGNRWLNGLVADWAVSSILNYSSGTPLGHPGALVSPVGWNGPGVFADFNTPAGGFKRVFNPSTFNPWNNNDPGNRFFDPSAFSDPGPQKLGNSPVLFPTVRGLWTLNEDATLMKRFPIRERFNVQFRLELLNALNRHRFGGVSMDRNLAYFGNIRTASGSRTGQFCFRVDW